MCVFHSLLLHQAVGAKLEALEMKLAELKAENKPVGTVVKQIILGLCAKEVGQWSKVFSLSLCSSLPPFHMFSFFFDSFIFSTLVIIPLQSV